MAAIRFDVLTLFPELFTSYLGQSLLKSAIAQKLVDVHCWDIRQWSNDKHRKVDDRPFGGGPGMVLRPEPVVECVEAVQAEADEPATIIMLMPSGERLTQRKVEELAKHQRIMLICGRYEGFDDRIRQLLQPMELSVGDFVCNGGEVPAMIVIDTVIRLIPGVLGDPESVVDESHNVEGRLEYPHYTRPRAYRNLTVPEVLLNGNHAEIAQWRDQQSKIPRPNSDPRQSDSDENRKP